MSKFPKKPKLDNLAKSNFTPMAEAVKKQQAATQPKTTVHRLITVLKWAKFNDAKLSKLKELEKKADEAFAKFKKVNKEYLKLKAADDDTSHAAWMYEHEQSKQFKMDRQSLMNRVMIEGPTPEVVKAVKEFCAKYNGGVS